MNIDERVRRALHHRAERIEPGDGSWERIQQRVDQARRRRRRSWVAGATGAVAAAVLLVTATVGLLGDGGDRVVQTGPATPSLPTSLPQEVPAIWPSATRTELLAWAESGDLRHEDPVEAVRDFAVEYLGIVDPVVGDASSPGPDATVEVTVQPRGEGGRRLAAGAMETIVHLHREGPPWQVLSTTSSNIRVDGDRFRSGATSPIAVSGEAAAYEGTVQIEVRGAGTEAGEALGRDFVTAGALGDLRPFATEVAFDPPTTEGFGALVLYTESAVDGSTLEATVIGLSFGEGSRTPTTTTAPGQTDVTVFFLAGEELVPVTRSVPATSGVLRASLEQLLNGPTEEERASGLHSLFPENAAGKLRDVTIDGEGNVAVDFSPSVVSGSAGTSTGSTLLLAQLNATVFQFPTVSSVEYRTDGSCEAFFMAMERVCGVIDRPGG
ncbi:MAG TPA: GerMN domain-containing protein [Acidimicrobiales bacterium]|nr:GerMN domain-containing protein [Acidimicrobiales bacterium]